MPVFNAWVCCFYYISFIGRCISAYLLLSHKIKCIIVWYSANIRENTRAQAPWLCWRFYIQCLGWNKIVLNTANKVDLVRRKQGKCAIIPSYFEILDVLKFRAEFIIKIIFQSSNIIDISKSNKRYFDL